jgi:purine-binding chemotaxis protein CheW
MTGQLCTFWVGDLFMGVEVDRVQEVLRLESVTPVPLAPKAVQGLINLRGRIVTAIDLRQQLGVSTEERPQQPMNLILGGTATGLSFIVDRVGDVVEVASSDFEEPPDTLRGRSRELILGAYKLPESLLLVLDTEQAARCGQGGSVEEPAGPGAGR